MELVVRHWSGKHHAVVIGINLITLLGTDGDRHVPVDYRIFDEVTEAVAAAIGDRDGRPELLAGRARAVADRVGDSSSSGLRVLATAPAAIGADEALLAVLRQAIADEPV